MEGRSNKKTLFFNIPVLALCLSLIIFVTVEKSVVLIFWVELRNVLVLMETSFSVDV